MDQDDRPVGEVLSRREVVQLLGASSLLLLPGGAWLGRLRGAVGDPPACIVRPKQTEGPYFVDTGLDRSDIRTDPSTGATCAGAPLALAIAVARVAKDRCVPIQGAHVELWQCDADGVYSGVSDRLFDTVGKRFLRGYQFTDAQGVARFQTIYPGWYPERTVHIHFKIRTEPAAARGHEFTSQVYFDDGLSDQVLARPPYAARGARKIRNAEDRIFRDDGGAQLVVRPVRAGEGFEATFPVGLAIDG